MKNYQKELNVALFAAEEAAKLVQTIYQQDDFHVEMKADDSPVTEADQKSDALIRKILMDAFPKYAILSEESEDDLHRLENDYVWIIDPLDGTKDFIAKTGEFSINIALAYQHKIVVGVIAIPAKDEIYYAVSGQGSYRRIHGGQELQNEVAKDTKELIVLRSHFHRKKEEDAFLLSKQDILTKVRSCGSSYKACLIASGKAHYAIKIGDGTKEWDIAASDLIVQEAGGVFLNALGQSIQYNRVDCYNHDGYVIMNIRNEKLLYKK